VTLLRRCHDLLEKAERKIELLSGVDADGNPIATAVDDAAPPLEEKAQSRGRRRSAAPRQPDRPDPFDPDDTGVDRSGQLF